MRSLSFFSALFLLSVALFAQDKKEQDREAILALEGCYKVVFDFAETFSEVEGYEYHDRYHSWGIEKAMVLENSEDKIVIQHLLVINDTMVIKHWRQDWVYENDEVLSYDGFGKWEKKKLPADKVKGTWTQKVYQVDDGPRYESHGTWVHVDGKHFWEGTADSPLPRREFSKRDDYNLMRRHSRMELTDYGWILEQDNEKIIRTEDGKDSLICWEKGFERFLTGDYNCKPADEYWEDTKEYWAQVRKAWDAKIAAMPTVSIEKSIDDKKLFERLFGLADEAKDSKLKEKELKSKINEILDQYLKA